MFSTLIHVFIVPKILTNLIHNNTTTCLPHFNTSRYVAGNVNVLNITLPDTIWWTHSCDSAAGNTRSPKNRKTLEMTGGSILIHFCWFTLSTDG